MKRIQTLDAARGIDIIFMILYNWSVTLYFFKLMKIPDNFYYWSLSPWLIAGAFIFLSGISAYASYKNKKENFAKRYLKRGLKLLFFAALITAFTYLFAPQGTVIFGILHFFAFTSFIMPLLIKYDRVNLYLGLALTIIGFYLLQNEFNFSYLLWLGFKPTDFFTFDYFPLMPWLGVLVLGIYFGRYFLNKLSKIKFENKLTEIFTFFGRHSLTIYLIHQPILVLILFALGFSL